MAILKKDVFRFTLWMPRSFSKELDHHIKTFALTDRGQWVIDAIIDKLEREKKMLKEIQALERQKKGL